MSTTRSAITRDLGAAWLGGSSGALAGSACSAAGRGIIGMGLEATARATALRFDSGASSSESESAAATTALRFDNGMSSSESEPATA